MKRKHFFVSSFITGTISLTATSLVCRIFGFFIRIFISRIIEEKDMGIFQLSLTIIGIGVSICAVGIQSAVSKMIADNIQKQPGQEKFILRCALVASLALSLFFSSSIFISADFICEHVIHEIRCASLLRMLSLSLPFCCIHACFSGFFYAIDRIKEVSISQLTEQTMRAGVIFCLWLIRNWQDKPISLTDIAFSSVLSDFSASLYSIISYLQIKTIFQKRTASYCSIFKKLVTTACPICMSRLSQSIVTTAENIMIPICLKAYGLSSNEALSLFGVVTAMAMPFIVFPSILTGSMAVLLLPKVAGAHTSQNKTKLTHYCSFAIILSLGLGCFCTAFFYICGPFLGNIFQSNLAGTYIRQLSLLCPFLYLNNTCSSILNGLGKSTSALLHTLISFAIRLICVICLIPLGGINAYLLGLLTSSLLICTLHISSIRKAIHTP